MPQVKKKNKIIKRKDHSAKKQAKKKKSSDNYKWDTSQFVGPFDYKSLLK